jgi:anti-anti-sigma regulatory factor
MSSAAPAGLTYMTPAGIRYAVAAKLTRADIPDLCAELADRLRGCADDLVICDVADVIRPDVVTVETLARLRLTARRHGARLVVAGAGPHLSDLLRLLGLDGALPEVSRQPEQREQPGGVEEERQGRDPPL